MKEQSIWGALREIIGGTPQEVLMKGTLGMVALVVSMVQNVSWFAAAFLIVLGIDAILGTVLAYRNGQKIRPMLWMKGPALKGFVLISFLLIAAVFDMVIGRTPVQHMGESPVVIAVSVIGVGAITWEAASKAQALTGLKITDWLGDFFNRFRKP